MRYPTFVAAIRSERALVRQAREQGVDLEASDFAGSTELASGVEHNRNKALVTRMPARASAPVAQGSLADARISDSHRAIVLARNGYGIRMGNRAAPPLWSTRSLFRSLTR